MHRNTFKTRRFERLEDRRLMAADIDLDNGTLDIQGTENNDLIYIESNPADADEVLVTIKDRLTNAVLEQEDYDREDVQKIVVHALGGDDNVFNVTDIQAELYGGAGDDYITSGAGNDYLYGEAGNDDLSGGRGNDHLHGGSGNDGYYFSGTVLGNDAVYESPSVDVDSLDFAGFEGPVNLNLSLTTMQTVNPGNLALRFDSATGIENVYGSHVNDTIRGNSRNNAIFGGLGNDVLYGGEGADLLFGSFGDDELYGEGGDDFLDGSFDNDILYGGVGNDVLLGSFGDDYLYGESGKDTLDGGADNDFLDGGYDGYRDVLTGGTGADIFARHRSRRSTSTIDLETLTDYNSAVDEVMTFWY
jgi:Ca2+-binding RTX toxin-like protein